MQLRHKAVTAALAFVISSSCLAQDYEAPLTEWGVPDLQGNWRNNTVMPFQRPQELGNKRAYSEEEALVFCLLYTSPSPRDGLLSRMPSSA